MTYLSIINVLQTVLCWYQKPSNVHLGIFSPLYLCVTCVFSHQKRQSGGKVKSVKLFVFMVDLLNTFCCLWLFLLLQTGGLLTSTYCTTLATNKYIISTTPLKISKISQLK